MRILFWNTNRNTNINPYLVSLVCDYDIDILVVAEYTADEQELYTMLYNNSHNLVRCNTAGCDRIKIWSSYINMKSGLQEGQYSIQIINDAFVLCGVHLLSDSYVDHSEERLEKAKEIMYEIQIAEEKIHSQKTIIVGDINEMPYGRGCLNANGFHGLPALEYSDRPTRKVNKKEYRKFYNPMWNLLGDFSYPPGTFYLNQSKMHSPMWYMIDQVILSKDILPMFKKESLEIITACSYADLKDKNQHPDKKISDHFPITCEICE